MNIDQIKDWLEYMRSCDHQLDDDVIQKVVWLVGEVERLEDIRHEYATGAHDDFTNGMMFTAQRCAEIANLQCRDSDGYDMGCETEERIIKEFGLEDK